METFTCIDQYALLTVVGNSALYVMIAALVIHLCRKKKIK